MRLLPIPITLRKERHVNYERAPYMRNLDIRLLVSGHTKHFLRDLHCSLPHNMVLGVFVVFSVSFVGMVLMAPNGLINGDAALYAQQIEELNLQSRTTHIGYYLLGIVFTRILPLPVDYALNIMNCLLAALCVCLVSSISYTITGKLIPAIVSSIALLTYSVFAFNGTYAEVYVPQLFFFLLSVQMLLWNRPIFTGLFLSCACLITPSTLLALPFIVLIRPRKRAVFLWAVTFTAVTTAVLMPVLHDFLFGPRGLLKTMGTSLGLVGAAMKEMRELSFFCLFLVFILVGGLNLFFSKKLRWLGVTLIVLWLTHFIFGEKFGDVPVQLPLYAMLCVVCGLGCRTLLGFSQGGRLLRASTIFLFVLALLVSGSVTYLRLSKVTEGIREYRDTVFLMHKTAEPNYLLVGDWSRGILFEHYIFRNSYTGRWINTDWLTGQWGEERKRLSWAQLQDWLAAKRQIWLLDTPMPEVASSLQKKRYTIRPFRNIYVASYAP